MKYLQAALLALGTSSILAAGCAHYVYIPPTSPSSAEVEVEVGVFYEALRTHGDWLWISPHGWVWAPYGTEIGWRPYTHGRWVLSDLGWAWVSDWSWGWAPFHYGRWTHHGHHGWVWIPGRTWAPAWVAWRHGDGWIGWAPLPPHARWRVGVGFDLGAVHLTFGLSHHDWCFVEERYFLDRRLHRRFAPLGRNVTLIRTTRDVTLYEPTDRGVALRSVDAERLRRVAREPLKPRQLEDVGAPPRQAVTEGEDVLRVYRPQPPLRRDSKGPIKEAEPTVLQQDTAPDRPKVTRDERRELQRELESWKATEEERLRKVQTEERREPPNGVTTDELRRRQKAEAEAQKDAVKRQRQVLQSRPKKPIEAKAAPPPSRVRKEPEKKAPPSEPVVKSEPKEKPPQKAKAPSRKTAKKAKKEPKEKPPGT